MADLAKTIGTLLLRMKALPFTPSERRMELMK
jgi:hypothetical protein